MMPEGMTRTKYEYELLSRTEHDMLKAIAGPPIFPTCGDMPHAAQSSCQFGHSQHPVPAFSVNGQALTVLLWIYIVMASDVV